jgi:hypothetical protein
MDNAIWHKIQIVRLESVKDKGKIVLVLFKLSTTPGRRIGEVEA